MTETTHVALAEQFRTLIPNRFVVLLNGRRVYPGACETLRGSCILVLPDSGKGAEPNDERLEDLHSYFPTTKQPDFAIPRL